MNTNLDTSALNIHLLAADPRVASDLREVLGNETLRPLPQPALSQLDSLTPFAANDILVIVAPSVDLAYLTGLKDLVETSALAVILFVDEDPERLASTAIRFGVTSFVVAGFEPRRVPTLIEVSIERFKLHTALRAELVKSQEELATRKVIERAKGLLMDRKQLNEQEAYRSLRELAMRQSKPLKEVAETILLYSDLLP